MDKGLKCKFHVETDVTGGGHTKDIDALMVKSAKILGYAIDMALHTHLSVEDIESLLS